MKNVWLAEAGHFANAVAKSCENFYICIKTNICIINLLLVIGSMYNEGRK